MATAPRAALGTLLLLAGCVQQLPTRTLASQPSYDAWCSTLKDAACKGEWPQGKTGKSSIGEYRFVVVDTAPNEHFAGGTSVWFELKAAKGFVYEPVGVIGRDNASLNVEAINLHEGVIDLRMHSRVTAPQGMSDSQEATLFSSSGGAVGVAHVHVGTNTRDELGRAKGHFGELSWRGTTFGSVGTGLKDGEYRLTAP